MPSFKVGEISDHSRHGVKNTWFSLDNQLESMVEGDKEDESRGWRWCMTLREEAMKKKAKKQMWSRNSWRQLWHSESTIRQSTIEWWNYDMKVINLVNSFLNIKIVKWQLQFKIDCKIIEQLISFVMSKNYHNQDVTLEIWIS